MAKSPFSSFKPPFFDAITETVAEKAEQLLPGEHTREEMQRSVNLMLQSALSKLDLVTREEFATQQAVLQKTRAQADALEQQVNGLLAELETLKNNSE